MQVDNAEVSNQGAQAIPHLKIVAAAVRGAELEESAECDHPIALPEHGEQVVRVVAPRRHGILLNRILAGDDSGNRPHGLRGHGAGVAIPRGGRS